MKLLTAILLASLMPAAALQTVAVAWEPQKDAVAWELFRVMPTGPPLLLACTLDSYAVIEGLPDAGAVIVIKAVGRRSQPDSKGLVTIRSIPSKPLTIAKKKP